MTTGQDVATVVTGAGGLRRAHASGARWIWVLAPGATPRADALLRLLEATTLTGPVGIVAGLVADASRGVGGLPGWDTRHPELVDLVARRVLPIRHATFANTLVASECLTRHGPPDEARYGGYAATEWTARVLRGMRGYCAPLSVVDVDGPAGDGDALSRALALGRMLTSGAWTRGEAIRAVAHLLRGDALS